MQFIYFIQLELSIWASDGWVKWEIEASCVGEDGSTIVGKSYAKLSPCKSCMDGAWWESDLLLLVAVDSWFGEDVDEGRRVFNLPNRFLHTLAQRPIPYHKNHAWV